MVLSTKMVPEEDAETLEKMSDKMSDAPKKNVGDIFLPENTPTLFEGELDLTKMEDGAYDILLSDGTHVNCNAPAAEFDAALVKMGFNLVDRSVWHTYHRALVLQSAPRGKHGVFLVEKIVEEEK